MAKGNDAIPTWSGFNYQGKIMLFYILTLMNQIERDNDKRTYWVELERTEDFCIIRNSEYISFHQVKAWLSTTKWISYKEAMDKLLQHRSACSASDAKCYLMAAKEIDDWNDNSNIYYTDIELYKYNSKVIGVCDVVKSILLEIKEYLDGKGYPKEQAEIVYSELCFFLDDKIATMHKQRAGKRCYLVPFVEFTNQIEKAVRKQSLREDYYLKEEVYKYIMGNMEQALCGLCQDECQKTLTDCTEACAAKAAYDKIMEISDYTNFCKVLNPSKIGGWDRSLAMAEYFAVDKLQDEIYDLMYQSKSPEKVFGNENGIYLVSKFSNAKSGQIIPTLLDLTRGSRRDEALQRIFQNIVDNTDIVDILEGNSITVIPGNYRGKLSQDQITSGWKESNPQNKINHCYRDIELISSEELLRKFEDNGGNQ